MLLGSVARRIDCANWRKIPNLKVYQSLCKQQRRQAPPPMICGPPVQMGAVCILYSTTEPIASSSRSILTVGTVNCGQLTAQLRVLHTLWPLRRRTDRRCHASGRWRPPRPFRNYSAYCVSKIALIKMCELIDDEASDANAFITAQVTRVLGIHERNPASRAGAAGREYDKVRAYLWGTGALLSTYLRTYALVYVKGAQGAAAEISRRSMIAAPATVERRCRASYMTA